MTGRNIIVAAWAANVVFAVVVIPAALGLKALDDPAVWLSLGLFLISLPIWLVAWGWAVTRTARGDDISVMGLFFLSRAAPREVQRQFAAALIVCIVIAAATAKANPFSVLVPMLPLGLMGLWGARHGVYPPRKQPSKR